MIVAIAAQRVKHIAGQTLRMNSHNRGCRGQVAHGQRDRVIHAFQRRIPGLRNSLKSKNAKVSPTSREVCFGDLANAVIRHITIIDSPSHETIHPINSSHPVRSYE